MFSSVSRRYLRETLKISNAEESHRLTACALILLGHTFLKHGNIKVWILDLLDGRGIGILCMHGLRQPVRDKSVASCQQTC